MKTLKKMPLIIIASLALSSCASPLEELLRQEITNDPISEVNTCLKETDAALAADTGTNAVEVETSAVDGFLNCFFDVDVPANKLEWRLVRGHAVVAMLSMYGAYSLKHSPVNQQQDAKELFGEIVEAEESLWSVSIHNDDAIAAASPEIFLLLEDSARHERIAEVAEVATASLVPAKRRLFGFFEKLSAVFATPTPSGIVGSLKDVRKAAKRAFTISLKGSDYISGTRAWMKNIEDASGKNGVPTKDDWEAIDTAYLNKACQAISFMAYGKHKPCSPTR